MLKAFDLKPLARRPLFAPDVATALQDISSLWRDRSAVIARLSRALPRPLT
jgi:hypothetical protein